MMIRDFAGGQASTVSSKETQGLTHLQDNHGCTGNIKAKLHTVVKSMRCMNCNGEMS